MNKELINEILDSIGLESIHLENEKRLPAESIALTFNKNE
ncbi:hypothetical protein SAMN02745133_02089 [Desulforamulus putei DSM 12395]|uniref:Uncharacterized protein n=1 Tax=Desulforamulus putei DSM 12395 TaxID=1121429 RepID=A0A1M4ZT41_9FIRM|nr:hypothetical protein SAMN02745133_02089 [Desulforamulus putei DSM 12395]